MEKTAITTGISLYEAIGEEYSGVLHKVIDVLRKQPPEMWIAVGNTISGEGVHQIKANKEGYDIEYD